MKCYAPFRLAEPERRCDEVSLLYLVGVRTLHAHRADAPLEEQIDCGAEMLLASDAGSFISGQTIYLDGAFLAGSRWNVPLGTGLAAYRERVGRGR